MAMRRLSLLLLCVGLGACPSPSKHSPAQSQGSRAAPLTPATPLDSVLIAGVPHVRQKPDFCGEAAVASWAQKLGAPLTQDDVFDASGMDPARGMGVTTRELRSALSRLGFEPGQVWHKVAADRPEELDAQFQALHEDLKKNVPSVVCMHYDDSPETTEHFRLILGYDARDDSVVYEEPAADEAGYKRMSRSQFLKLWPLHYAKESVDGDSPEARG